MSLQFLRMSSRIAPGQSIRYSSMASIAIARSKNKNISILNLRSQVRSCRVSMVVITKLKAISVVSGSIASESAVPELMRRNWCHLLSPHNLMDAHPSTMSQPSHLRTLQLKHVTLLRKRAPASLHVFHKVSTHACERHAGKPHTRFLTWDNAPSAESWCAFPSAL
jgi:hypothetical protein